MVLGCLGEKADLSGTCGEMVLGGGWWWEEVLSVGKGERLTEGGKGRVTKKAIGCGGGSRCVLQRVGFLIDVRCIWI